MSLPNTNPFCEICACRKQVCECPHTWKVGDTVQCVRTCRRVFIDSKYIISDIRQSKDGSVWIDVEGIVEECKWNWCSSLFRLVIRSALTLETPAVDFIGYPAKTVVTEGCGSVPGYLAGTSHVNMDDPINWKVGDIVTAVVTKHDVYPFITSGKEYKILRKHGSVMIEIVNDAGNLDIGRSCNFKFCRHAEANSEKPIDNPPLQKPLCGCCSHFHGYDVHHDDPCVFTHLERYEPPIRKADFRARMTARNQEIKARIRREDNLMKLAQSENAISAHMRNNTDRAYSRDVARYQIRLREECED